MAIRVGFQKSGITPEDHRLYASVFTPPAAALTATSGLTAPGGALTNTGAMTATIGAFRAVIQGTSSAMQGAYPFVNDATSGTLTFTDGHATLPRRDLVVADVRDNPYDSSGAQDGRIRIVTGTANAAPVAPAVPTSAIPLWEVLVPAGVTAGNGGINWGSNVTDRRIYVGWGAATIGVWAPYSPVWTSTGTAPSLGGNGTLEGAWHRVGRLVTVRVRLVFGSGTTGGTGGWRFSLPVAPYVPVGDDLYLGTAFAVDLGTQFPNGIAIIGATGTTVKGFINGAEVSATWPFTFGTGDSVKLQISYEAAS